MCLWEKPFNSIWASIQRFNEDQKAEEDAYWIDMFNQAFPNGKGLESSTHSYVKHYIKKGNNEEDDESSSESESEADNEDVDDNDLDEDVHKKPNDLTNNAVSNAVQTKPNMLYQTAEDLLMQPAAEDECYDSNNDAELNSMACDYIANSTLVDVHGWIPQDENLTISRIEMIFTQMMNTQGDVVPVYATKPLTKKQEMVRRIVMDWINDRIGDKTMEPLRLFVLGLPGVGKKVETWYFFSKCFV